MNRVHIKTYGCQMNERDSEAVAAMLRARGYRIVASEDDCDILLLNTCSVRDAAEQKAIGKAGYASVRRRRDPDFVLGILGCMAQNRGADLLERLPDVDLIVGTQKFHRVPDYLDNLRAAREAGIPIGQAIVETGPEEGSQNAIRDHVEGPVLQVCAFVSIQQGCDMNCSFCIVPRTRGDERSRPMDDIVRECEELAGRGVREVTLLGQIVTSYGRRDYPRGGGASPFVQLLERVHAIPGIERIRFTSPHPCDMTPSVIAAMAAESKVQPYLHLPVQSGSDRLLAAMERGYTVGQYLELVERLRRAIPGLALSTDIIVGFHGEEERDFEATMALMREVGFDSAFTFKYSVRENTRAYRLGDSVSEAEKARRLSAVIELQESLSTGRNQAQVGKVLDVLVEGPARRGAGMLSGKTPHFKTAVFPGTPNITAGDTVPVRIVSASSHSLVGVPDL